MSDIDPVSDPAIDTNDDWAEKARQHAALAEAIRAANKTALFDKLSGAGISIVIVQFDGYGDSGQIENIEAKAGENLVDLPDGQVEIARVHWGSPDIERSTLSIRDAVEQLAFDFLEETHDGWEINEGAYGDFTFDVAERMVTLDYNWRSSDAVQHIL